MVPVRSTLVPILALVLMAPLPALAHTHIGAGYVLSTLPTIPDTRSGEPEVFGAFPEGIVVDRNQVFVSGPATFGTSGLQASTVQILDEGSGALIDTVFIEGEDLSQEHALSCIAVDHDHRLYVLSTQLGVVRLTPTHAGWAQDIYATPLPDLPMCTAVSKGTPCSPTQGDYPPLSNDLAFDAEGNLYITDSFQATIFRVRPGGGAPEIWFQSPLLEAASPFSSTLYVGANGLRVSPDNREVYFNVTFPLADPTHAVIYTLPRIDAPHASDLRVFHRYDNHEGALYGQGTDGFAFGESGNLYVALAATSEISILGRHGEEAGRLAGPAGSAVRYNSPANVAFNDATRSLLITNHALFCPVLDDMAVLEVFVDDRAAPLFRPRLVPVCDF